MVESNLYKDIRIVSGSSHPVLAAHIAENLGLHLSRTNLAKFSCGETYARLDETVRGADIYVIQTIDSSPNDDYMELFLLMDALKRASAQSINVVIPHFGYARQDKKSAPREPISARLIADLLSSIGFDRLITMDLHADQIQGFFDQPVDHLTALPLFASYFIEKQLTDLVVVAPDAGRAKFAKRLSDRLNAELAFMHKTRPGHNIAEITHVVGDVKDKTVLLIDDMVDTGGSVSSGINALRNYGCNNDIYLATTHGIFSGPAVERLQNAGFKEVVVTDTLTMDTHRTFDGLAVLSVAEMFAEAIRRNIEHCSISTLYV